MPIDLDEIFYHVFFPKQALILIVGFSAKIQTQVIYFWNTRTGKRIDKFFDAPDNVGWGRFVHSSGRLVQTNGNTIETWDPTSSSVMPWVTVCQPPNYVTDMIEMPDERIAIVIANSPRAHFTPDSFDVKVWDFHDQCHDLIHIDGQTCDMVFLSNGNRVYSEGVELKICDQQGRLIKLFDLLSPVLIGVYKKRFPEKKNSQREDEFQFLLDDDQEKNNQEGGSFHFLPNNDEEESSQRRDTFYFNIELKILPDGNLFVSNYYHSFVDSYHAVRILNSETLAWMWEKIEEKAEGIFINKYLILPTLDILEETSSHLIFYYAQTRESKIVYQKEEKKEDSLSFTLVNNRDLLISDHSSVSILRIDLVEERFEKLARVISETVPIETELLDIVGDYADYPGRFFSRGGKSLLAEHTETKMLGLRN